MPAASPDTTELELVTAEGSGAQTESEYYLQFIQGIKNMSGTFYDANRIREIAKERGLSLKSAWMNTQANLLFPMCNFLDCGVLSLEEAKRVVAFFNERSLLIQVRLSKDTYGKWQLTDNFDEVESQL